MGNSKEVNDKINKVPLMLVPTALMKEANDYIEIYKGNYTIKYGDTTLELEGGLQYEWFPNSGVYFYGEFISNAIIDHFGKKNYTVFINGDQIGEGLLISSSFGSINSKSTIKGLILNQVTFGDISVPVEEVRFSIPNLREFFGDPSKEIRSGKTTYFRNRIELHDRNYTFTLDKLSKYKNLKNSVRFKGGFINQYAGSLKPLIQ